MLLFFPQAQFENVSSEIIESFYTVADQEVKTQNEALHASKPSGTLSRVIILSFCSDLIVSHAAIMSKL